MDGNISRGDPFPAYFPSFPSERKDWDSEVNLPKFPHASVVPICITGARKFMEPGKARIRLFTPIEVEFGEPITFSQWLTSPGGFNLTERNYSDI